MTRKDYILIARCFNQVYRTLPEKGVKGYFLEFLMLLMEGLRKDNQSFHNSIFKAHALDGCENEKPKN